MNKLDQNTLKEDINILVDILRPEIKDDYRADDFIGVPSMKLTVAVNADFTDWNYQTGDNSYTGPCYAFPYWAVVCILRDDDTQHAEDMVDLLVSQYESVEYIKSLEADNETR